MKYDFAGWVTKNDIKCSDGVTIRHNAFKDDDGEKVPLVWNHDQSTPSNILGHVVLQNRDMGVYGYGHFNDSEEAAHAKTLVQHGDISSMSIRAHNIKRRGSDVVHGKIREVSLVLAAANPGALIESIVTHGDNDDEEAIVYTGTLIHSADDIVHDDEENKEEDNVVDEEKTVGDVIAGMTDEQRQVVEMLLADALDSNASDSEDLEQNDKGDKEEMKHNVFDNKEEKGTTLTHADFNGMLQHAITNKTSLKEVLASNEDVIQHGITNIEKLFPEATNLNKEPVIYRDTNTNYTKILSKTTKSPFSRIKTRVADFTEDEARARGYIKGNEKKEQIFPILDRETTPQTVYKKQKLDRDDIIDITDFDVVQFIQKEMRFMLEEEIARAILVGDGREVSSEDKIKEDKIRPVIKDADFHTLKRTYVDESDFIEAFILGMADYKGSGAPSLYIDPTLLAKIKLLKGTDNRPLFGRFMSDSEVATMLGVSEVVPTTFMAGKGAVAVNLSDYHVGSTRGGEVTTFDDFDIDFNQYKYLIETRLCGALVVPHAAVYFTEAVAQPAP